MSETAATAAAAAARARACVPGLRALALFGSCLSEVTRRPDSIPDLLAVVDDLDAAVAALGAGRLARRAARLLPPATVALRDPAGTTLAKLNLVEPAAVDAALAGALDHGDLYLAGRLSKRVELLHARDAACAAAFAAALDRAADVVVEAVLLAPPRRLPLAAAVRRCLAISYAAEVRPERAARLDALYDSYAPGHDARFAPRLAAAAAARGFRLDADVLTDDRPDAARAAGARQLRRLLRRGRLRALARWPKQALLYDGWLRYVAGKLLRAWRPALTPVHDGEAPFASGRSRSGR